MTHLYLIRHGEAVSNVEPIMGGMRGDTGLTFRGIAQAERLRDRLIDSGEIAADVLIASTLPRARQTAEIIAPALGLPIMLDDEVQEMRPGEADGMTLEAYREKFGLPDFDQDPFRPLAPGGEGWATFTLRVSRALERISQEHAGKTVVIVCHGGVVDVSFVYFFGIPALRRPPMELYTHNTSITHWEHYVPDGPAPNGRAPRWRLRRYNDDAHLRGLDVLAPRPWREMAAGELRGADEPSVPLPAEESRGA